MKVKNVVFSGFMAAILSATGANAAISVASKAYVDKFVGENGSITTELNDLTQTVTANKTATDNALDLKANTADVEATYATKTFVGSLEGKNAATIVEYIENKTADIASGSAFSTLTGRVDSAEGKITALEALTGTDGKIAQDIAKALTDAEGYADGKAADAQAAAEATAKGYVDALNLGSVGADGSYIKLVSQANGQLSATAQEFIKTKEGIVTGAENAPSAGAVFDFVAEQISEVDGNVGEALSAVETAQNTADAAQDAAEKAQETADDAVTVNGQQQTAIEKNASDIAANKTAAETGIQEAKEAAAAASTAAGTALTDAKKYADDQDAAQTTAITEAYQLADTNLESSLKTYADTKASAEAKKEAKAVADTLKLLATAPVPEECVTENGSNMCVLTMTSTGTFAWTPLTYPVDE